MTGTTPTMATRPTTRPTTCTSADILTSRVRRPGALRVGTVLLLVAIVPLIGIGLVSVSAIRDAQRASAAASVADAHTRAALEEATIEAAIADEMYHAVAAAIAAVDSPTEPSSGTDDRLGTAIITSDELLAAANDRRLADSLTDVLARARSAANDPAEVLAAYDGARLIAVGATDAALEDLLWSITVANHDGRLLESSLGLVYLIDSNRAIAEQYTATISLLLAGPPRPGQTPSTELTRLIEQRGRLTTNLGTLEPLVEGVSVLGARPGAPTPGRALDMLIDDLGRRIDSYLAAGPTRRDTPSELTGPIDELRSTTAAAADATGIMLGALTATMLVETDAVRSRADGDAARSYALAVVLMLTTLATALMATRFIVRPLRELQRAADAVRDGLAPMTHSLSGPAEIRAAAAAIDEAAIHLELVTEQALALAAGDLDAAVLEQHDPTGLGAALQLAVATLRTALVEQDGLSRRLAHEATHDALTGLPNRRASLTRLTDALARWRRSGNEVAVLFIDLDHFKEVNDTHGHRVGDLVLTTTAARLVGAVREGDHVGRLGGDEFVVIAEPVDGPVDATALAQRMLDACTAPLMLGEIELSVGISIGVALGGALARPDADELLHHADLALYRAKSSGRGTVGV